MNLDSSVGGVTVAGRAILGADNAVMTITLPEPPASLAAITGWITLLGVSQLRRLRPSSGTRASG